MNLVLIGMPGAGKTSVGERLAQKLNRPFLDSDEELSRFGMPGAGKTSVGERLAQKLDRPFLDSDEELSRFGNIPALFERLGEEGFRKLEEETIERLSTNTRAVLSTGGGAVENERNVARLKESGKVFFLNASIEALISRLQNTDRPLLKGDLKTKLTKLYKARKELYFRASDYVVEADGSIEEVAEKIFSIVKREGL